MVLPSDAMCKRGLCCRPVSVTLVDCICWDCCEFEL